MENVCRTCLRIIGSTYSIAYLNKTNKKTEAVSIREKLESCVPELTLDIVVEPAICSTCTSALNLAYQFKSTCIQTEKTLYTCIKRRQKLNPSCTDLLSVKDLLKIARKDINSEHNYSYVERFSPTDGTGSDSDSEPNYEIKRSTAKLSTNVQSSLNAIVLDSDAESPVKSKPKVATKRASSKEVHQNGSNSREHSKEVKQKEQDPPPPPPTTTKEINQSKNITKEPKQVDSVPAKETKQKVVVSKESSHQFKQQMKELQDKQKVLVEKVVHVKKTVVEGKPQTRESQNKQKILNTSKEVKVMEPQERQKTAGHLKELQDTASPKKVSLVEGKASPKKVSLVEGKALPKKVSLVEPKASPKSSASKGSEIKASPKSGASRVSSAEVKQLKEAKSTSTVKESPKKQKVVAAVSEIRQQPTRELRDTQKTANISKESNNTQKITNVSNQIGTSKEPKAKERLEKAPVDKEAFDRLLTGLESIKNRTAEPNKAEVSKDKGNCSVELPKSSNTSKSKAKEVVQVSFSENDSLSLHISEDEDTMTPVKTAPVKTAPVKTAPVKTAPVKTAPIAHTSPTRAARGRTKSCSPRKVVQKLSPRAASSKGKSSQKSRSENKRGSLNKAEGKSSYAKSSTRRGLSNPIKKSLDKIIQKLKEHADHDCGPIVNIEGSSPKKMPKILPLSDVSTSKNKSQENVTPPIVAIEGRNEIGSKKRKAFNIERRQIGIKRSCRENQKPVVVKYDDVSEEELVEEEEEVKPIQVVITTEDDNLGERVTKLVDDAGNVTYRCTRCDKIYRYMSHFEVHERAHILTKLFSCLICNKTFSHEKHLKAHLMIHKNLGPYKCRLCSKRLSSTTALKRHLLTHTGEKAFNCTVCQKAFAQKIQLSVHMRIHTGLKPFVCNICEATFTQKSHLMGHVKIHTGEKPYKCDLCWKQFRKPYALSLHKECHQRKPFQCKSCDFLVKDVETFKRHIHKHLLGRLPLKNKTNKPKQTIINELKEDFKNVNKLKRELKKE